MKIILWTDLYIIFIEKNYWSMIIVNQGCMIVCWSKSIIIDNCRSMLMTNNVLITDVCESTKLGTNSKAKTKHRKRKLSVKSKNF